MGRLRLRCAASVQTAALAVFAGQSNMMNINMTAAGVPGNLATAPDQYIWTGVAFEPLVNGTNNGELSGNGENWGPEAEFGRQWAAAYPGRPLYMVKHAKISDLFYGWASDGAEWLFLEGAVEDAKADLVSNDITFNEEAFCWMQGEGDAGFEERADAYGVNFVSLISRVRALGNANTAIIAGRINAPGQEFRAAVRSAQTSVIGSTSRAALIDTDGYTLSDGIHYDLAGNVQLGADMFTAYQDTL